MNSGKQPVQMHDGTPGETLAPELNEFAKWLLADPRSLEVWCLAGARLAHVECTADAAQALELDSGDWFLVRVSALRVPTTSPSVPWLRGIVRCVRFSAAEKP
jgi:hypothetical protein